MSACCLLGEWKMSSLHLSSLVSASLVLFVTVGCTPLMAQNTIFNGPRNYLLRVSGYSPNTVVIADFNRDGLPDIAVANNTSNNVSVLLQNSNRRFQTAVNYAVGNQPMSTQVGDVNGDGYADLILVNNIDNTLGILLGNGDGTLRAQQTTALPVSALSVNLYPFLVVGDWNVDGKTDVAVAGALSVAGQYALSVLLSNGDGTFQPPVTYPLTAIPGSLNASDFNGDGKLDLATADFTNGVSVWLGNGNGTFKSAMVTSSSQRFWPGSLLVVADFNQDGHLDIATTTMGDLNADAVPNLSLFLGNGDGTFEVRIDTSQPFYSPYSAGDVNGDGKPDLLVNSSNLQTAILLNSGNAIFTAAPGSLSVQPGGITFYQLNDDQKLDLVVLGGADVFGITPTTVSVLYGNGNGTFAQFPIYGTEGALVTADFNNDGKPDLADAFLDTSRYLNLGVLANTGAGFSAPTNTAITRISESQYPVYIVAGDFNHDGNMDTALSGTSGNGIFVLLGNGNGTFQTAVEYGQQVTGPLAVADFNHDGKADIVGSSTYGSGFEVLLGNGDGTFGFPIKTTLPCCEGIETFVVGDFNKDGKPDVAAITNDGKSLQGVIHLGNGDGTFTGGASYNPGAFPICMATADLNGDGKIDLIIGNRLGAALYVYTPPQIVVLLGDGDGTFQAPIITNSDDTGISSISVADFNLDGKLDIATSDSGGVALLLGNGDGTLQSPIMFFVAPAGGLVHADFDGNGAPDLAVGGTSLLLNAAGGKTPAALVSPTSLNFGSVLVGQSSSMIATLTYNARIALSIIRVTLTGAQPADFSETNTCGTTLAAGMSCTITVTFTPLVTGARAASIQIADSAFNTPQVISLSGTGSTKSVLINPGSLAFGSHFVGSTSAAQTVSLSNIGTSPLTINSISVTGPQADDFVQTNNCGSSLASGAGCTMTITFTPAASGARIATLDISDSASSTSQTVVLSGTGTATSIGLTAGSNSTTATVQAGQTANYTLLIGGAGMSGKATLSCSGAPTGVTCTVPGSLTVNATTASTVNISVSTTAQSSAAIDERANRFTGFWVTLLLGIVSIPMVGKKRNPKALRLSLLLGSLLLILSCGGSNGSNGGGSSGTPAGTYNLAITAALNSSKQSVNLRLIVQ